ncbi:chromate resistance protein ChrB domain-containing protein [Roseibacillus persicicus]|uniref:chromate resistance protein ChrB domain-containing protein n=1 Tax=Roseibacillus persicicus TaxID=454148 RepID=UPI00398B3AF3
MNTKPALWFLALLTIFYLNTIRADQVYVTESGVQVDRCACAWFILRFLDAEAEFKFFKQGEKPPQGIGFDYYGAPYFHKGVGCSFTAFIKKYPRKEASDQQALVALEAIVNDSSGWRQGPKSLAATLQSAIREIAKHKGQGDDQATISKCLPLFDYLYAISTKRPAKDFKAQLFAQLEAEEGQNFREHYPKTLQLIKQAEEQGLSPSSSQK